jgi:hypothetical protein
MSSIRTDLIVDSYPTQRAARINAARVQHER